MACDRDPFALRPGDSTGVRMELYATVTEQGEVKAGSATITGQLACYEGGAGTASMKGRLRHTWMHVEAVGEGAEPIDPIPVKFAVELQAVVLPGGARSVVAKVEVLPGLVVSVTTTWGATPILAKSRLTVDLLGYFHELLEQVDPADRAAAEEWLDNYEREHPELAEVQLARATARENADVLRVSNPYHGQAVQALRRIEAAVREPGFRVDGERKLFPPAPPLPAVPSVAATRDWVLFRRRRASSCDCCPPAAAVAVERRYRLYTAALSTETTVDEVRAHLDDPQLPEGMVVVGVVPRYPGGSIEPSTPASEILQAWKDANPGVGIFYGMVAGAGEGAGDADSLLSSRLDRVASAVGSATPTMPKAEFDVLSPVPPALSAAGVDGVMLLLTYREEEEPEQDTCVRVLRLEEAPGSASVENRFRGFVGEGNLSAALALAKVTDVDTLEFTEGDSTISAAEVSALKSAWTAAGGGEVSHSFTVYPDIATEADRAWYRQERDAVANALQPGTFSRADSVAPGSVTFDACPSITVLVVVPLVP
jgi:hypothetical protein